MEIIYKYDNDDMMWFCYICNKLSDIKHSVGGKLSYIHRISLGEVNALTVDRRYRGDSK